jgi:hypothetical protein
MSPFRVRLQRARVHLALYGTGASVWVYDAILLARSLHH